MKTRILPRFAFLLASLLLGLVPGVSRAGYEGTCTPDGVACAYFSPSDMPIHAVGQALRSARSSIRIATYNMDVLHYVTLLEEKLKQGIPVEFMVDYKLSIDSNIVWRSLADHPLLRRYRLPVMRGGNPQMHNKIIIVDNAVVLLGSANFTYSGLVANYENVLAIRDPGVVQKFNAELDELRAIAHVTCEIFATPATSCGKGTEAWDPNFHTFLYTGKLPAAVVARTKTCKKLTTGSGLFTARNQPAVAPSCFTDPRYGTLLERVSPIERFVDGTQTASLPATKTKFDNQRGRFRVYFSPEDNVEQIIVWELEATLKKPAESFAYIATNFITNYKIASTLVKMKAAGVRMKIFFDRGRYEDEDFKQQLKQLENLGFTRGETGMSSNLITVFNNDLTGPYACNHNKMAVIGVGNRLRLVNGSANWSSSAMNKNDENLVVIEDSALAAIYLREILSQLYVYRYYQQEQSAGFVDDLNFLIPRVPCLKALLGLEEACTLAGGATWRPAASSSVVLSVAAPFDGTTESVWAWVAGWGGKPQGGFVPLYTHRVFNGRWVAGLPGPRVGPGLPPATLWFKFIRWPTNLPGPTDPSQVSADRWEFGGFDNRRVDLSGMAVQVIRDKYTWGQR
jgi:phosphatidylserine/phosphatidylglycerophosphate/cardiolipin synthase-like enzyme